MALRYQTPMNDLFVIDVPTFYQLLWFTRAHTPFIYIFSFFFLKVVRLNENSEEFKALAIPGFSHHLLTSKVFSTMHILKQGPFQCCFTQYHIKSRRGTAPYDYTHTGNHLPTLF